MRVKKVIDTTVFMEWAMLKYGMTNSEWHRKIWRPYMCDYFMESRGSVGFGRVEKPENEFQVQMNDFVEEMREELGETVWMEFTN